MGHRRYESLDAQFAVGALCISDRGIPVSRNPGDIKYRQLTKDAFCVSVRYGEAITWSPNPELASTHQRLWTPYCKNLIDPITIMGADRPPG